MKYQDIISQLTLEEKAGLCSGFDFWHLESVERLGIPSIMVSDGPHGLRKQQGKGDHLGLNESIPATCFPTAVTVASSWDRSLVRRMGEALGEEARSERVSVLLGPGTNIKRSPLCGRNFEYFSEDPYLAGEMAAAYINGVQSKGVGTSLKHFAVNNQETRRDISDSVLDERTLREIYLAPFERAVREAQPWTVMAAYNLLNGVYCAENKRLLDDILRKEWGFKGIVVTDWGAENDRVEGIKAGQNLEMPACDGINDAKLVQAVRSGALEESVLDESLDAILDLIYRAAKVLDENHGPYDKEAHHALAREIARESMVLLKNEDQILPVSAGEKIAVIGAMARSPRYQGAGSSKINPTQVDNAFDALLAAGISATYSPGYYKNTDSVDAGLIDLACRAAEKADKVLLFAGLTESYESEGYDRTHMRLPENQNELIRAVTRANPNTAVILAGGSPVEMPWADDVKAILNSYLGGQASGSAVADLLTGKANPSGKLAETYPMQLEDTPCYGNYPGEGRTALYREGIYVGYRYYDKAQKEVRFPFGFGLSYTQFKYSALKLSSREMDDEKELKVTFKVKNTGDVDGAEVAQVYVSDAESTVYKAPQELKGFEKIFLRAGEEKQVTITLDRRAFAYYDVDLNDWNVEDGVYHIFVAASSRDVRLKGSVKVHPAHPAQIRDRSSVLPSYYSGNVQNVSDAEFEQLIGRPIPPKSLPEGTVFDINSTLADADNTRWGRKINQVIAAVAPRIPADGLVGSSDMLESIVKEMPVRKIMMMTSGLVNEEMCGDILQILNDQDAGAGLCDLLKNLAKQATKIPKLLS